MWNSVKKQMHSFLKDESGQSTTEYVLLLLFVVIAVRAAGGTLKTRITGILDAAFNKAESAVEASGE